MSEIKKENWFVRTWAAITKYFRELISELKKVVWPTPQQVGKNTLIVGACCGIVGVCIWMFDLVANLGIDFIISIPSLFG
ncbi:MAG: preprotein translocase subunit SecE [Oscillospiraceae bacterium]|nr:preprotein translocase subunit SecE [Oscillospiraceae bacterium]